MRKPLIGIVGKKEKTSSNDLFPGNFICYDYIRVLDNLDVNYIGLITNDEYKSIDEDVLKLCDGFLFPGGSEIKGYHYAILEYAYNNKIPVLGICLGCQTIGLFFSNDKKLEKVSNLTEFNHKQLIENYEDKMNKTIHKVQIKKNSILHRLFGDALDVNSRHDYCLSKVNEPLEVVAISSDGIIEAVELVDKEQFMVGVQWHPEIIDTMVPLFTEFIEYVYNRMNNDNVTFTIKVNQE